MHSKNQVSSVRKTLYGVMLFALLVSTFGGGGVSLTQAKEKKTKYVSSKC